MPKKEYSVELLKLLEILKTNNPTQLQHRKFKELNQEEREIYMAAVGTLPIISQGLRILILEKVLDEAGRLLP